MTYNGWCAIKPNRTKPNENFALKLRIILKYKLNNCEYGSRMHPLQTYKTPNLPKSVTLVWHSSLSGDASSVKNHLVKEVWKSCKG